MSWLEIAPLRARALFRQRELDTELEEELQFHLEKKAAELVRGGFTAEEARRAAGLEIARFEPCKEECRDTRGVQWFQETWRDFQFAARLLRKAPAFTWLAISTLGLALGANAMVFSFVSALLLKPLPYGTPENRLVLVWEHFAAQTLERVPFSAPEVNDMREHTGAFDEAAAFRHSEYNLTDGGEPERIQSAVVSWNLFSVLGAPPKFGRAFTSDDAEGRNGEVAVISETLWARRFASDPNITGKQIHLSGRPHTVIGVMPAAFRFPLALFNTRGPVTGMAEVWKPIRTAESSRPERASRTYGIVARMSDRADLPAVNEDLARLGQRWEEQYPQNYDGRSFGLSAHLLRAEVVGRMRPAALIAGAAVFILLLVALANVIALLLARAKSRERELAVRIALGAGSGRLFRQFFSEGILLALFSGVAALGLAGVAMLVARLLADSTLPLGDNLVFWVIALSALTGFLLGVVPGCKMAARARSDQGPISPARLRSSRLWEHLREALVIGETALALVLLVAAGLLAKSFLRLSEVPLGFNPAHVLTMEMSLPTLNYSTDSAVADFFSATASEIAKAEGVTSAAFVSILPLSGISTDKSFTIEGASPEKGAQVPDEEFRIVTPDYFAVLEIPLTRGRLFTSEDDSTAPPVVVINEAFARRYWPAGDAIGRRIRLNQSPASRWMEVIGVVGNVKHRGLDEPERPEFYLPHMQSPSMLMTLVARTNRPLAGVFPAIRERVRSVDPAQAIANVRTLDRVIAHSLAPRRLLFALVSAFAVSALLLATGGIYGVVTYLFAERQRDVAMRIALGASRRAILGLAFKRAWLLVGIGGLIGLPLTLAANQHLAPMLYDVSLRDLPTFVYVFALLLSLGGIAVFVPARRAARSNVMSLLRCD